MTSVAHNHRDELRAVIPNAIAHSGDTFNKINGITEEAVDFLNKIIIKTLEIIYQYADVSSRHERKTKIDAKFIQTTIGIYFPPEENKYYVKSVPERKANPERLKFFLPLIKKVIRRNRNLLKMNIAAKLYLAIVADQIMSDFLLFSVADNSFNKNGIVTLYNIVFTIKNNSKLRSFVKKIGVRLPKNVEKDEAIASSKSEEKKEASSDEPPELIDAEPEELDELVPTLVRVDPQLTCDIPKN